MVWAWPLRPQAEGGRCLFATVQTNSANAMKKKKWNAECKGRSKDIVSTCKQCDVIVIYTHRHNKYSQAKGRGTNIKKIISVLNISDEENLKIKLIKNLIFFLKIFTSFLFLLCGCVLVVCECGPVCTTGLVWRSENNVTKWAFFSLLLSPL